MLKYFKESNDTIYKVFTSGKLLLIFHASIQIIDSRNKYLEFSISNSKYLKDSLNKVCKEIDKKEFEKISTLIKKPFKKSYEKYEEFENKINSVKKNNRKN